jgi:hypothetical protein
MLLEKRSGLGLKLKKKSLYFLCCLSIVFCENKTCNNKKPICKHRDKNPELHDKKIIDFYNVINYGSLCDRLYYRVGICLNPSDLRPYNDLLSYEMTFQAIEDLEKMGTCLSCAINIAQFKEIPSLNMLMLSKSKLIRFNCGKNYTAKNIVSNLFKLFSPGIGIFLLTKDEKYLDFDNKKAAINLITIQAMNEFSIQEIRNVYQENTEKLINKTIMICDAINELCESTKKSTFQEGFSTNAKKAKYLDEVMCLYRDCFSCRNVLSFLMPTLIYSN